MLPEGEGKARDLLDALVTGSQVERLEEIDGKMVPVTVVDPRSTRVKLSHINSNTFGQAIFELMEWIRNGNDAEKNMCKERAEALKKDVIEVGDSVWLSYDAKGSETIGINKDNSQTNYIGMIGKNKQERVYTMNDKKQGGMFDRIVGRKVEDDD